MRKGTVTQRASACTANTERVSLPRTIEVTARETSSA